MIYSSQYDGNWYPKNKNELEKLIKDYLNKVDKFPNIKKTYGIIAPHAGYIYSGQTAAYSFAPLIDMEYDTVVILAPSHRAFINKISTFNFLKISTPLGTIEVDNKINETLMTNDNLFVDQPKAYMNEHSFELMLPFLQYVSYNKKYKVLPLIIGDLSFKDFDFANKILKETLNNKKAIFIASSDFTHYGESFGYLPFEKDIQSNIFKLDNKSIDFILNNKIEDFYDFLNKTEITICGRNPILLIMNILSNAKVELLNYTNSGMLTNDFTHSVSYASIVFGN